MIALILSILAGCALTVVVLLIVAALLIHTSTPDDWR